MAEALVAVFFVLHRKAPDLLEAMPVYIL